ncbi:MAG: S-methyl-5-thioribose-1-phosphate isomerase [Saprospiraceae bacterium]|nr:S-methyl-5-thioribose-1-phosphate isomerase [Saprospiraceae bacterium]
MKIQNQSYRTIWLDTEDEGTVHIIDQRSLPHALTIEALKSLEEGAAAIREMHVRGAPLIGVTAAYSMYLGLYHAPENTDWSTFIPTAIQQLQETRPTAVDLFNVLQRVQAALRGINDQQQLIAIAKALAAEVAEESVTFCRNIGLHGLKIIEDIYQNNGNKPVNVLTHCNAGWMACIDYGTATSPIYAAHDKGIPVHVWVDETRPRNQGARITAFELKEHGVPHTVIVDNLGGHLMQHQLVDMVIVGTDRTTRNGDVANKIGTYLKALAAHDNEVPFYVALPSSSIDWTIENGLRDIPIEERSGHEVKYIQGLDQDELKQVLLTPAESPALNYGFDVTPARLVTGLITERGICAASEDGLSGLFPELND